MNPSLRKPFGVLAIIAYIALYAALVVELSAPIGHLPALVQAPIYPVLGVVWILPLGPLFALDGGAAMSIVPAADCATMAEIRAGVDDVDRRLVTLLAERLDYMDAAARVKTDRAAVRDEARKAQVIANAVAEARRIGLPDDLPPIIWEPLIEYSIAHEMVRFEAKS